MKKGNKFVILSLAALAALSIPVGAAVAVRISSERNCGRTKPPTMRVDGVDIEQKSVASDPFSTNEMVFGDYERNYCIGYVDGLKKESLTGDESAAEMERITRKNALIKEYREYVEALYGQPMTEEEYEIHYQHLMDIYCDELLPLEPEPTPEEVFIRDEIGILLLRLEEHLEFSSIHGEVYIQNKEIDLPELERAIEELTSLKERAKAGQLSLEQMQQEYAACLEVVKRACPPQYAITIADE